ncbi:hypothetical protein ACFQNE_02060 [Gordonia phosphorivorans]|uniref:Uncharacterized protein n=1 Tax=Gordonia phosphorivorans TaxID=1056982 RepID=A0ABV6H6I4_9ACTN
MSRTHITMADHPEAYLALTALLHDHEDLRYGSTVRVPEGRGWIVQSSLHPPFFECEVWALDADGDLLRDPANPDDLVVESSLRRIPLPADFPLPVAPR